MASLTLTIGPLTSSVTAANDKATNVVTQYAAAIGATGTNQQKLDAVVQAIVRHMRDVARSERRESARYEADASIAAELAELEWTG